MTTGPTVSYIVNIVTKAGTDEAFAALAAELCRDTRVEPGCTGYSFLRDREDRRRFTMLESFRDFAALMAHGARLRAKYGAPAGDGSPLPAAITQYFEQVSFVQVDEITPAD